MRPQREAATILLAQYGVLRQQAEADEQVRLAAAHGLLEVKDALGRSASEPGQALADEVLHALGDVGFLEELGAVAFRSDQCIKLLDLVAELDGQRIGLQLTGITDGLHMRASWQSGYSTNACAPGEAERLAVARAGGAWAAACLIGYCTIDMSPFSTRLRRSRG